MVNRGTGASIEPPTPCTILATTSIFRFCAAAHNSEPVINTAIEPTNTLRVPKRSAR